jgi:hypothetical protein
MEALDGNAIAGQLFELFGVEMTTAVGVCAGCSARRQLAETLVYVGGPGTVMRCRECAAVLAVFVTVRELTCVDLRGLSAITS